MWAAFVGQVVNLRRIVNPPAGQFAASAQAGDATSQSFWFATVRPARWQTIRLMPMKVREAIRLLEKHGWVEMRSRGSHRHFKHPGEAMRDHGAR